jgi:hypothetical protein
LRLLLLFIPLALVIVVMARLRDPKTADTVNNLFTPAEQQTPIRPPLGRELGAERRLLIAGVAPEPETASSLPSAPIAEISPDLLKTIQDNTYFRTAEKEAWFHFIELLQNEKLDPAQAVNVEYVQLVDQPNVYRGKLVTVRGTARQITQEKPAANDLGLTSYYRVVIQPADGANWPIIVYCLELPKGVSPGDDLSLGVKVTGLFFKKLSYKWQEGLGIAPVILAESFSTSADIIASASIPASSDEAPVLADGDGDGTIAIDHESNRQDAFQKILSLAGWDSARLAKFDEGASLTDGQRTEALQLLRRLRSIDTASLNAWSNNLGLTEELKNPNNVRGRLCRLNGRVKKVTKHTLPAADAERLEMPAYFECEVNADNLADPVTIFTARVPKGWLQTDHLNDFVTANVLFIKRLTDESPARTLWLAKEIAWHPSIPKPSQSESIDDYFRGARDPLLGKSILGTLLIDVGQLDLVESRGRIRPQERDMFYEIMSAASLIKPSTLARIAKDDLPVVKQEWEARLQSGESERRKVLAREVIRRADEGRYSVAMLFNDPEPQIGRLFVFDGVARRAVRVEVGGASRDGESSAIAQLHDIDHYYELEVFTDDSQNYPLIFCVRELPEGFPVGGGIHVPVRMAGFFFKNWLYSTRGGQPQDETIDGKAPGPRAQFAPLLIGPSPMVLPPAQPVGHAGRFVLGGLFVLGLLGIWIASVRFARDDRRFREKTPAASFSLPPGQSLNDLNLPAVEVPMMIQVDSTPPSPDSSK